MRTYACLALLVVLDVFCQAQECPDKQYFDADEDLCRPLPTNFTMLFSATQYNTVIESENPLPPNTHLFDMVLYINNNTLGGSFPDNTVFLLIDNGVLFGFEGEAEFSFTPDTAAVFNTIELSVVSGSEILDFNKLYSTTITAFTVPQLGMPGPGVSVIVSVNVTKFDSTYNCNGSECMNGGICIPVGNEFICNCTEGYQGVRCEYHVCDSCNNGNCSVSTNYTCECYPGYTDSNCSTNIDDCIGVSCGNGTCVDEVNGYSCDCNVGFTGDNCSLNIDDCDPDPCVNGTCSDLINGYTCDCYLDWEGKNCNSEIDLCADAFGPNFPCDLIGYDKCIDGNNTFSCECRSGYTGNNCSIDIDECAAEPCKNNGTCKDLINSYDCECIFGYEGDKCQTPVNFCQGQDESCGNGTCRSIEAIGYECDCDAGYSGDDCSIEIDECLILNPCENEATCIDFVANYSCLCPVGFTGVNCSQVIDNCDPDPCLHNSTCTSLIGSFRCDCSPDYIGTRCEIEEFFCNSATCLNGGTCSELDGGNGTVCSCLEGFSGNDCSDDLDFCMNTSCENGGTCMEGYGTKVYCECPIDFGGDECEVEMIFCSENYCLNNGTCIDLDEGSSTMCICVEGFSGDMCDEDIEVCNIVPQKCFNGATCLEGYGANYTCQCADGFGGSDCSDDLNFCEDSFCLNGGMCVEGIGAVRECNCTENFLGERCETAFCPEEWCYNGGTCSVESNTTVCSCKGKCSSDRCEQDLSSPCEPDTCQNGGTCMMDICDDYICVCPSTYTGDDCEIPLCQADSCMNGGTCRVMNNELVCDCPEGFNGTSCEVDLNHCTSDYCMNGGTCMEGFGVNVECICPNCFNGDRCEVDLNYCQDLPDYCLNDGTCVDGVGCDYSCDCPDTYQGETCETAFCPDSWCFNGGTCSVQSNKTVCSCESGCGGDRCETDEDVCVPNLCFNGGICTEGLCSDYTCNCTSEFEGDNCDIPLCQADSCMNGGTCRVMNNELVCDCPEGFNGTSCEFDLSHCTSDYCMNGGTCMEGFGVNVECICPNCFNGDRCEVDLNYCQDLPDYCLNGGTCVDGVGCEYSCDCPDTYQGETCETAFCPDSWCFNGGTCSVQSNKTVCSCESGCGGDRCETDEDVCVPNLCFNGGICTEGLCSDYTCNCTSEFEGDNCEIPFCQADTCKNGGTCTVENNELVCECQAAYGGLNCEIEIDSDCRSESDCSSETFCEIECVSDSYAPHTALLSDAVTLKGLSFVNVEETKHPDLSSEFSMIAVYNQEPQNRGYLIYYGTSAQKRNFGVFLDSLNSKIYLYYTNTTGHLRSYTIEQVELAGGYDHFLAVSFTNNVIYVYLNGTNIGIQTLSNTDFTHGVTANSPAKLFLGARYPRHYRFVGTIKQVTFFSTLQSLASIKQMQDEFYSLIDPVGNCVPYKQLDSSCPSPMEAPSTLCTSSKDRCSPSLRCLPDITGDYTCQLQPPTCSSDLDCSGDYFCGSELPFNGSNYFDNSATEIPGETVFLQDSSMEFDGEDVVTLPTSDSPDLQSDITIFAVVYQESGNDGYVVGKGINGNMRDFGLYLRSSRKTVWLVYGADSHGVGYKEIVFFHNVSVADGNTHSIAAVVDSTANRTLLYIDGEIIGQQSPLPSEPTFRPGHNLLYVGGRPSTRYFRFKGTIRNLFVSSAPLQKDTIVKLHNDAMSGDQKISLQLPTSRYCLPYRKHTEPCILGDESSDFRCLEPAVCIPECSSSVTRNIPSTDSAFQQTGICVEPCTCDDETNEECGVDGSTYKNTCFRECLKVTKLHDGKCSVS